MSRIGERTIDVPDAVTVTVNGSSVAVKGPKGELSVDLPAGISATAQDKVIEIARADDLDRTRSFHGLGRSLVANMVEGVSKGFSKELEIQGVGYKAAVEGRKLTMSVGLSHQVEFEPPEGVVIEVNKNTQIRVSGPDKQKVGDAAARIRAFKPAEPYKGKGLRYKNEYVRRKVGKTVA